MFVGQVEEQAGDDGGGEGRRVPAGAAGNAGARRVELKRNLNQKSSFAPFRRLVNPNNMVDVDLLRCIYDGQH